MKSLLLLSKIKNKLKINETTFLLVEPFDKILSLVNDRPTIPF